MHDLPHLISDLALILGMAGIVTLIFKRLKQPLVLGYIVAGFLASPHMPYSPSITDISNINTWANIGVIFLLFTLGLDFSFKKIVKMGASPMIAVCSVIFTMMSLGFLVGRLFDWKQMDCIYLGGMLAMSSTTIIYKAFDDMGLRQQKFAGLVLSVLILEDILAILMMVMLSTLAVRQDLEGDIMIESIIKLGIFLILCFIVGIYIIPNFLRKYRKWINRETLLIVSIALCFGMVLLAEYAGLSAAFGAFMMGSILAETVEAEQIEKLVSPVKDLFGAIFFVSVGMLVDPAILIEYALPILAIVATILIGQSVLSSLGFVLAGQPLSVAMRCGFSLTQIGEFSFIIASLGVSLAVTSPFLYPIVVAVSVITTFLTPYMIRASIPAHKWVEKKLPERVKRMLNTYTNGSTAVNHSGHWRKLLMAMGKQIAAYLPLSIAIVLLSLSFFLPFLQERMPLFWANSICGVLTILVISPFLRAIVMRKNHSFEFTSLWQESVYNRLPLIATIIVRMLMAAALLFYIIYQLTHFTSAVLVVAALLLIAGMMYSKTLKQQSIILEKNFLKNLRSRDKHEEMLGKKQPKYAGSLLSRDIHISSLEIPSASRWVGKTLYELNLRKQYGVHIASVIRGKKRFNIPDATMQLFPNDVIQVIGTDKQMAHFVEALNSNLHIEELSLEDREMQLRQLIIDHNSPFIGKSIIESQISQQYNCMVVGIESSTRALHTPDIKKPFQEGDVVWIVGELQALQALCAENILPNANP